MGCAGDMFWVRSAHPDKLEAISAQGSSIISPYVKQDVIPALPLPIALLGAALILLLLYVLWCLIRALYRCCLRCRNKPIHPISSTGRFSHTNSDSSLADEADAGAVVHVGKGRGHAKRRILPLALFLLLGAGAMGLCIWGLVEVPHNTAQQVWSAVQPVHDYLEGLVQQVMNVGASLVAANGIINQMQYIAVDVAQVHRMSDNITILGGYLDQGSGKLHNLSSALTAAHGYLQTVNDSLTSLPPAMHTLIVGLPTVRQACRTITSGPPLLADVATRTKALQASLSAVPSDQPLLRDLDPRIAALHTTLDAVTPQAWSDATAQLAAALNTLQVELHGTGNSQQQLPAANTSMIDALGQLVFQLQQLRHLAVDAAPATLPQIADATSWLARTEANMSAVTNGLVHRLQVINSSVILLEGNLLGYYGNLTTLQKALHAVSTMKPSPADVAHALQQFQARNFTVPAFVDQLLAQLTATQKALASTPSAAPYAQFAGGLSSALGAQAAPQQATVTALAAYISSPSDTTYAALVSSINPPTSDAVSSSASASVPNADAARTIATVQAECEAILIASQPLESLLQQHASQILAVTDQANSALPQNIIQTVNAVELQINATLNSIPATPSQLLLPASQMLNQIYNLAQNEGPAAKDAVNQGMAQVQQVADQIHAAVVQPIDDARDNYYDLSTRVSKALTIVAIVLLALCIALLLLTLLLAVLTYGPLTARTPPKQPLKVTQRHWCGCGFKARAGLLTALQWLLYIMAVLFLILALLDGAALVVGTDGCPALELAIINAVSPQYKPIARYYLLPDTDGTTLRQVLGANFIDPQQLDIQVANLRKRLNDALSGYTPVGLLKSTLSQLNSFLDGLLTVKTQLMSQADQANFKQVYLVAKEYVCCTVFNHLALLWHALTWSAVCLVLLCGIGLLLRRWARRAAVMNPSDPATPFAGVKAPWLTGNKGKQAAGKGKPTPPTPTTPEGYVVHMPWLNDGEGAAHRTPSRTGSVPRMRSSARSYANPMFSPTDPSMQRSTTGPSPIIPAVLLGDAPHSNHNRSHSQRTIPSVMEQAAPRTQQAPQDMAPEGGVAGRSGSGSSVGSTFLPSPPLPMQDSSRSQSSSAFSPTASEVVLPISLRPSVNDASSPVASPARTAAASPARAGGTTSAGGSNARAGTTAVTPVSMTPSTAQDTGVQMQPSPFVRMQPRPTSAAPPRPRWH